MHVYMCIMKGQYNSIRTRREECKKAAGLNQQY